MTMRTASEWMTYCEYLRLINDLCQSDSEKDKQIREYCAKAEKVTKKLGRKIAELDPNYLKTPGLYETNPNWKELLSLRLSDNYKQSGSKNLPK
jgi:hypothetical protein